MKKTLIFTLGLFISMVGLMSCGDGGDDEARQQAIRDSLRNDSIQAAEAHQAMLDSLYQDSLMQANDSLANAAMNANNKNVTGGNNSSSNNGGSTTTTTTTEETPANTTTETGTGGKDDRDRGGVTGGDKPTKSDRDRDGVSGKNDKGGKGGKRDRERGGK